jgi:integrase
MAAGKLTTKKVEAAKAGRHGDGSGLWLVVSPTGSKRWVYRFTIAGKVSESGLGSFPTVSLSEAREKAAEARKLHKAGKNPVEAKRAAAIEASGKPTFGTMADSLIASKAAEWRNEKHKAQWKMTLERYCAPIRSKPVDEIRTEHVLEILTPLWQRAPETASRLRGRIEAVLDAAKAKGYRTGENPALWRGHLAHLLPKRQRLTRGHHAAMAYADVPQFITKLRKRDALAALALEFTILTACRSGEVLGARWDEIDMESKVWEIPANRMKAGKLHRVPLVGRAYEILQALLNTKTNEFVFSGHVPGKPLNNLAMHMMLRRMRIEEVTIHGFRSAFRDWCGDETSFQRDVAEAALAHVVGGVEGAYRRSDALDKRRQLMEAWTPNSGAL